MKRRKHISTFYINIKAFHFQSRYDTNLDYHNTTRVSLTLNWWPNPKLSNFDVLLKRRAMLVSPLSGISISLAHKRDICLRLQWSFSIFIQLHFSGFCQISFADSNPPTDNGRNKLPEMTTVKLPLVQWQQIRPNKMLFSLGFLLLLYFFSLSNFSAQLQNVPEHIVHAC